MAIIRRYFMGDNGITLPSLNEIPEIHIDSKPETKLYCLNARCKYCNDNNKCTAGQVKLNFEGLNTVHQGFREVLSCETFEESELSKQVAEFMRGKGLL